MITEKKYLVVNGVLQLQDAPIFTSQNRAFRYGDGLFETVRFQKGEPLFWSNHYSRLIQGMSVLKFSLRGFPSSSELKSSIQNLVVKNRLFYDSRIRITVFRKDGGLYTPQNLTASWIIEAADMKQTGYQFAEKGIFIDLYRDFPKLPSPVSAFKTIGCHVYILAGIYNKENGTDDSLIINGNGKIIESISSNLFWVKNGVLFTPLISTGCIEGIFRKQVLDAAETNKIKSIQTTGATEDELLDADELFLTNSINGIRWVAGFRERRYYTRTALLLYKTISGNLK
ncbi:aminotransferase class IV [Natronoflexus pectinivorans]|uniref:branched-chain-amino-acid transaminase n=1 Tax=Natronoflexus pectinivorans TaxID=682526 RepID=A0A4R2GH31_9BACT|nr:aminotransferase class IV [Natronoflexus pectinivorans]TCO07087.1 branched-chain amino acid aminotransferase [Natronoflexus pectinivorans]